MKPFPDFDTFFHALWQYHPFPWQRRLADQTGNGGWPRWLTLPTGTGKTAALDVAIYDLARQAGRPPTERTAPVRIVFAVNRRIVVDEAYERAKHIAGLLMSALEDVESVLYPVAFALGELSGIGGGLPLETYPLRGATFTDHSWARTPTQPLVITTTLDQLGSRLLFRGYGVSPNARPIHAAMLANDALLILDEAHSAKAFSQTLKAISELREKASDPIRLPFAAVQLTATPPAFVRETFSLDDEDRADPKIHARLNVSKPSELIFVKDAKGARRHKKLADEMAVKAAAYLKDGQRRILIVVNRVATAEALFSSLNLHKAKKAHGAAVKLLTGRMRPLDRQELIGELTSLYQLGSSGPSQDVPCLILIATQCIEVGADYDFDALLTELAPLDSLRQRFGRLNRQGRDILAPAAIFAPGEALDISTLERKCKLALETGNADLRTRVLVNGDDDVGVLEGLLAGEISKTSTKNGDPSGQPIRWIGFRSEEEVKKFLCDPAEANVQKLIEKILVSGGGIESTTANNDGSLVIFARGEIQKPKKIQDVEFFALPNFEEDFEDLESDIPKLAKKIAGKAKKSRVIIAADSGGYSAERVKDALVELVFNRPIKIELGKSTDDVTLLSETLGHYSDEILRADPTAPRVIFIQSRGCPEIPKTEFSISIRGGMDPLYGECLPETWAWLHRVMNAMGQLNFGLSAIAPSILGTIRIDELLAPAPDAPILLEPHLDLLCQTSPEPHICPDPSLYIHGPGRGFPEVSVVLRGDLGLAVSQEEMLKAVPPLGTETATVPLYLARGWLQRPEKMADAGGDAPEGVNKSGDGFGEAAVEDAFRWRDGEAHRLARVEDLVPGDILVLPTEVDPERLARLFPLPDSAGGTLDQFERAHLLSRDRMAIRFHTGVIADLEKLLPGEESRCAFRALVEPLFARDEEDDKWRFSETEWTMAMPALASHLAAHLPATHPWKEVWQHAAHYKGGTLRPAEDWRAVPYPRKTLDGVILLNRSRVGATPWPFDPADLGRQGSEATDPMSLEEHSGGVARRAASNARGLPDALAKTVCDAGGWHDLGKLDPRFQAMLHGCSLWAVAAKSPLAKSGPRNPALQQFFAKQAELPKGFRHELLSALLVGRSAVGSGHPERDLLLHLIASHHGRCRPMAPAVPDRRPEPFDLTIGGETIRFAGQECPLAHLSEGVARRFWTLTRRFGWWGLPYLEAMLRLADQIESAKPSPTTPP